MKRWIHASSIKNRGNNVEDELRKEWYTPENYEDVDPERLEDMLAIEWDGVTAEDSECILYDDIDLKPIAKISYLSDADEELAKEQGFDGGYVFTYKDGSVKKFCWRPYPHNLDGLDPVELSTKVTAGSKLSNQLARIREANRQLMKYGKEKVDYVHECQDEIMKAISDSYVEDEDGYMEQLPVGPKLSEIKRDYLVGALEDDLMTEEEFEDIFDLLDIVDIELSESAI